VGDIKNTRASLDTFAENIGGIRKSNMVIPANPSSHGHTA
jgi:hypothetical protein